LRIPELISKWEIEFKKGFSKPIILLTLSNKPNYPYNLAREINENTDGQISIAVSNLYPILKFIADEGLIEKKKEPKLSKHSDSKPSKRKPQIRTVYSTTSKGEDFLKSLKKSLEEFITILNKHIEQNW
jgi:DNA-binding PadR family transcriptional regulator